MLLEELNRKYETMTVEERILNVYNDFEKVLFTSSFGTSAAILLHLVSKLKPEQKVHFIDTTYHFAETIEYRDNLTEKLGLKLENVLPADWKNAFTRDDRTWTKDPDLCCSINKVEPLDQLKPNFEVWMSGLMRFQNHERRLRKTFERKGNLLKFHPIIDLTEEDQKAYFEENDLPRHPLEKAGFSSIGCAQCTFKGKGRSGRWGNSAKTECGLHL
jgi:phosphoadenosine phosphosulfate reductase